MSLIITPFPLSIKSDKETLVGPDVRAQHTHFFLKLGEEAIATSAQKGVSLKIKSAGAELRACGEPSAVSFKYVKTGKHFLTVELSKGTKSLARFFVCEVRAPDVSVFQVPFRGAPNNLRRVLANTEGDHKGVHVMNHGEVCVQTPGNTLDVSIEQGPTEKERTIGATRAKHLAPHKLPFFEFIDGKHVKKQSAFVLKETKKRQKTADGNTRVYFRFEDYTNGNGPGSSRANLCSFVLRFDTDNGSCYLQFYVQRETSARKRKTSPGATEAEVAAAVKNLHPEDLRDVIEHANRLRKRRRYATGAATQEAPPKLNGFTPDKVG